MKLERLERIERMRAAGVRLRWSAVLHTAGAVLAMAWWLWLF